MALLVLFSLIATACGSGVTSITADPVVDSGADAAAATSASGHQYGVSIDEWSAAERENNPNASGDGDSSGESEFATVSWDDLIPPGFTVEEVVARYEDELDALEAGSPESEAIYQKMQEEIFSDDPNPGLDGQKIRLAGFVAPLTYEDEVVTEFLLVPSFGACIHVPPPPPNQTVLVTVDKADGLEPDEVWGAVWVEGTIKIDPATTDLAAASYTIVQGVSGVYTAF